MHIFLYKPIDFLLYLKHLLITIGEELENWQIRML